MIEAHGPTGKLMDLLARDAHLEGVETLGLGTLTLSAQQVCDLELLMNGGFSPLTGFMGPHDYHRVCRESKLCDGTVWPMPLPLRVEPDQARCLQLGQTIALLDPLTQASLALFKGV